MLTTDFYEILTHSPLKCFFKGVYAADQIPTTIKKANLLYVTLIHQIAMVLIGTLFIDQPQRYLNVLIL